MYELWPYLVRIEFFINQLPFAGAGHTDWGALAESVSGEPTEDPVKNGACLRHVTHRKWVKMPSSPFRVWRSSE